MLMNEYCSKKHQNALQIKQSSDSHGKNIYLQDQNNCKSFIEKLFINKEYHFLYYYYYVFTRLANL